MNAEKDFMCITRQKVIHIFSIAKTFTIQMDGYMVSCRDSFVVSLKKALLMAEKSEKDKEN